MGGGPLEPDYRSGLYTTLSGRGKDLLWGTLRDKVWLDPVR
jgi:hypothetical protein